MLEDPPARKPQQPNYVYLTPLFLTLLPIVRVAFQHKPVLRDRLFYGVIGVGILHGVALMSGSVAKERR
jgi:hypothetical protein